MAIKKTDTKGGDINYEVLEECGELTAKERGGTVKLRYLSWNGRDPRYDLRRWRIDDEGNEICGKGIGLSGEELEELYIVIGKLINSED